MSVIEDFTAQEFLHEQFEYYRKLKEFKGRVVEICNDFGKIKGRRNIEDIDIREDDEIENEYYIWVFFSNGDEFVFPAEWINSDEYKEKANEIAEKIQEKEKGAQYEQYLKLKELFEVKK